MGAYVAVGIKDIKDGTSNTMLLGDLTLQFVEALDDRRHVGYIDHTFLDMTRMRVYGILADYADQNDRDVLRSDPILKLILRPFSGFMNNPASLTNTVLIYDNSLCIVSKWHTGATFGRIELRLTAIYLCGDNTSSSVMPRSKPC